MGKTMPKRKPKPTFYHLSRVSLGESFWTNPVVPESRFLNPVGDEIEDSTTPRTCFSTSLKGAGNALTGAGWFVVYEAKALNGFHDPQKATFKGYPGNKYGPMFVWGTKKPTPRQRQQLVVGCVPDAASTGEVWATLPTLVVKVGYYNTQTNELRTTMDGVDWHFPTETPVIPASCRNMARSQI